MEKRLIVRQKAVEAATKERDPSRVSLQTAQDKLHEEITQRREQEAEVLELHSQMAADLPGTPVRFEEVRKTIMSALDEITGSDHKILINF